MLLNKPEGAEEGLDLRAHIRKVGSIGGIAEDRNDPVANKLGLCRAETASRSGLAGETQTRERLGSAWIEGDQIFIPPSPAFSTAFAATAP